MNHRPAPSAPALSNGFQHHEMVHVPVQDGRKLQAGDLVRLQPHAAPVEIKTGGDVQQGFQVGTLDGDGETVPQGRHVDHVPVACGHYGKAGKAALHRLGLAQQWQAAHE